MPMGKGMPAEVTGLWEDLVARPEFRGHQVKITIIDQSPPAPKTDPWVESLREMARNGVRLPWLADDSRESIY
jgi:hypothetical protein